MTALIATVIVSMACSACAGKERIRKRVGVASSVAGKRPYPSSKLKRVRPYTIRGVTYYPLKDAYGYNRVGSASWYGPNFHGKKTANGEIYDMNAMTAAHKTLPLGTMVEVTRVDTGRKIVVRINDRGPFVGARIIDLSRKGAGKLDMLGSGTAKVRVVALARGKQGSSGTEPVLTAPAPDFEKGRFFVQVGAFSDPGNAERLKLKLPFPGETVRLERFTTREGQTLTRVRIGPYGKEGSANAALAEIADLGFPRAYVIAD